MTITERPSCTVYEIETGISDISLAFIAEKAGGKEMFPYEIKLLLEDADTTLATGYVPFDFSKNPQLISRLIQGTICQLNLAVEKAFEALAGPDRENLPSTERKQGGIM